MTDANTRLIQIFKAKINNIRLYHPEVDLTPEYISAIIEETAASLSFAAYTNDNHEKIKMRRRNHEASQTVAD